jgi:flagella basal body P-ring formation protein FlgA
MNTRIAIALVCLSVLGADAFADEVVLRGFYEAKRPLVRLEDIADFGQIEDDRVHELEALPLFPAPAEGLSRRITAQDVREIMSLHGISMPGLRLTGECRVDGTAEAAEGSPPMIRRVSAAADDQAFLTQPAAEEQLTGDLIAYLQTKDRIRTQWNVRLLLSKDQPKAIAAMERREVTGGQAPWSGRQVFSVRDRNAPGSKPVTIKADVQRVAQAVITRRNIAAGRTISADDVELSEVNPLSLSTTVILDVNDAIGKEAKRVIPAGQTLQTNLLQRPLIVKRGEMITVFSVAAGVQIKATAKSLADAALGDTILLEATETKKQFQGRVTAPQEAMVFVDTPKVTADAGPAPSGDRTARRTH